MDIFALDKFLVHCLFSIGAERLFIYSLFTMGITNALCASNSKKAKK